MKYAVISSGGKQYKVAEGQRLRIEKINGEINNQVRFDQILLVSDGDNINIGQPIVPNMAVVSHIVEQGKAKKILVFKYKKRKRFRRKQGHRQLFTMVQIDAIQSQTEQAPIAVAQTEQAQVAAAQ